MQKLYALKPHLTYIIYAGLDILCVGMGMGVPIACIVFGFFVGVYIALRGAAHKLTVEAIVKKILPLAALTAGLTFVLMLIIWVPWLRILFDPAADYSKVGIPDILYEPKASFIGWEVLMIVISPFLQMLMTVFGAHAVLTWRLRRP